MINPETKNARLFALTQILDSITTTVTYLEQNVPEAEQGMYDWYDNQYNGVVDVLIAYNTDKEPTYSELFIALGMANRNCDKAKGKGWADKIKLWGEIVAELEDWQEEIKHTAPDLDRYSRRG